MGRSRPSRGTELRVFVVRSILCTDPKAVVNVFGRTDIVEPPLVAVHEEALCGVVLWHDVSTVHWLRPRRRPYELTVTVSRPRSRSAADHPIRLVPPESEPIFLYQRFCQDRAVARPFGHIAFKSNRENSLDHLRLPGGEAVEELRFVTRGIDEVWTE